MSFAYITEEGAYIQKRGGSFTVGRNRECIMEIPAETLEGLTLIDTVQVSCASASPSHGSRAPGAAVCAGTHGGECRYLRTRADPMR